jgi:ABC-type sugar transport system ATPase subunit
VALQGGHVMFDKSADAFTLGELSEALSPGVMRPIVQRPAPVAAASGGLEMDVHGQTHSFRSGEIVGLFGMAAGPQFQLVDSLYTNADRLLLGWKGGLSLRGPREAIRQGVYYVSADCERDGLLADMSALDNLILPRLEAHTRLLALSHKRAAKVFQQAKQALNVRGGHMDAVTMRVAVENAAPPMLALGTVALHIRAEKLIN